MLIVMSAPFGDFGRGKTLPLSAGWGARPFATRRSGPARLFGLAYLPCPDACMPATRSGLPGCAVGGVFLHAGSVIFFGLLSYTTALNKVE